MKKILFSLLFAFGCAALFAESLNLTDLAQNGIPKGWTAYGKNGTVKVENGALRITDKDAKTEWGICRKQPIAKPGKYVFSVEVAVPEGGNVKGNVKAFILSTEKKKVFGSFAYFNKAKQGEFTKVSSTIEITDPAVKSVNLYIYSSYADTCDYLVRNADFSAVE